MSGLHSKCMGGGVALAHPRTAKYFYKLSVMVPALAFWLVVATPRTHTKPPQYRAHTHAPVIGLSSW